MPRIRLTRSGLNVAGAKRSRGEEVEVDPEVASYLTAGGQAELVREVVIETTTLVPRESSRRGRRPS